MSLEPRGGKFKGDFFVWKHSLDGYTGIQNTAQFAPIGCISFDSTETNADTTADFQFIVRKMRATVISNTYDAAFVIAFRRNATTPAGASISITAATAAEFVSGTLSIPIQVGDLFDISVVATGAGASKTISGVLDLYCQRVID